MMKTSTLKRVTLLILITGSLLSVSSCAVSSHSQRRIEGERVYNQLNRSAPPVRSSPSVQDRAMTDALNKIPTPKQGHYNNQGARQNDSRQNNRDDGSFIGVLLGGLIRFFFGGGD